MIISERGESVRSKSEKILADYFYDNGIEYYLVSDVMKTDELLQVVRSISVLPVSK